MYRIISKILNADTIPIVTLSAHRFNMRPVGGGAESNRKIDLRVFKKIGSCAECVNLRNAAL